MACRTAGMGLGRPPAFPTSSRSRWQSRSTTACPSKHPAASRAAPLLLRLYTCPSDSSTGVFMFHSEANQDLATAATTATRPASGPSASSATCRTRATACSSATASSARRRHDGTSQNARCRRAGRPVHADALAGVITAGPPEPLRARRSIRDHRPGAHHDAGPGSATSGSTTRIASLAIFLAPLGSGQLCLCRRLGPCTEHRIDVLVLQALATRAGDEAINSTDF